MCIQQYGVLSDFEGGKGGGGPKILNGENPNRTNAHKTKFMSLYNETQKQFFNPTPTPEIAHYGPKNSEMTPK